MAKTAKQRVEFEEKIQNYQQKWLAETGQYHHALPNWAVEDSAERGKRKAELKEEHRKLSQKRFEEKMQQRCAKQTVTMLQRPSKERRQTLDEPAAQMLWEPQT